MDDGGVAGGGCFPETLQLRTCVAPTGDSFSHDSTSGNDCGQYHASCVVTLRVFDCYQGNYALHWSHWNREQHPAMTHALMYTKCCCCTGNWFPGLLCAVPAASLHLWPPDWQRFRHQGFPVHLLLLLLLEPVWTQLYHLLGCWYAFGLARCVCCDINYSSMKYGPGPMMFLLQ